MTRRRLKLVLALLLFGTAELVAQASTADVVITDTRPGAPPPGVTTTPATTEHPKLIGFGMLAVGGAMGFILFGRRKTATEKPL